MSVKPDRSYYLPDQNARVEVHGDYLFGKPVSHGHVKVVGEEERTWNHKEQKWEVKQGAKYEGEADERGQFTALVNLKDAHRDLADEDSERFQDLHYSAYITDPTTGRTEERRFDLRITKLPIHVYLVGERFGRLWKLPVALYISASYADGTPAECNVELHGRSWSSEADEKGASPGELMATVRTNRYGVAKVAGIKLPHSGEESGSFLLTLDAHDAQGRAGHQREEFYGSIKGQGLRIETDKTLYRDGEPIEVHITATIPQATVQVNVAVKEAVVESQRVELHAGHALVQVPYLSALAGDVIVGAFVLPAASPTSEPWETSAHRTVIYPKPHGLNVQIHLDRDTHRPGEEAGADFAVAGPNRQPVESDLAG